MNEEWKTILEAPDYEVSKNGKFRNKLTKKVVKTRVGKRHGYVKAFIPNPDNLPQVDHINGIKTDNCVKNLEWVTGSENTRRAYRNGLAKLSSDKHMQEMTEKTKKACVVVDILESKKYFFETRREASAFFGKSPSWATTLIKYGIGSKGRYYGYDVK